MGIHSAGKFYTDVADTSAVTSAQNSAVVFANSIHTGAVNIASDNASIKLTAAGLYRISVNLTAVATAATSDIEYNLYANGLPVAGARGGETIAAIGDVANISFETLLTVKSGTSGQYATLTLVNTGAATSYSVANVIVEKVA